MTMTTTHYLEEIAAAAIDYAEPGWPPFPLHPIIDGVCGCIRAGCTTSASTRLDGLATVDREPAGGRLDMAARRARRARDRARARAARRPVGARRRPAHGGEESLARLVAEHGELPPTGRSRPAAAADTSTGPGPTTAARRSATAPARSRPAST